MRTLALGLIAAAAVAGLTACEEDEPNQPPADSAAPVPAEIEQSDRPTSVPSAEGVPDRIGSGLTRTADGKHLLLADEDHGVLRRIPLPVDVRTPPQVTPMPGRPAQALALADRFLVTVREPGMLIELVEKNGALIETARVDLPDDAWGLAITADGRTAVVTSAWTHQVTAIDLASMKTRWTLNAAREPRGIAISETGTAYVSHLVGGKITKIEDVRAAVPVSTRIEVPPAPLKSPPGRTLDASLGYAAVLSPDGSRLLLPRHALGAQGPTWWFGAATVDVMLTRDETSLAPRASARGSWADFGSGDMLDVSGLVAISTPSFVQPRAAAYRRSTDTLLVAGEGDNALVELDARAMDPSLATKRRYGLARYEDKEYPFARLALSGGAPSAIALSADEKTAWVHCRSTNDLAIVTLDEEGPIPFIHLADDDALTEDAKQGKTLFYDATDTTVSGGLACSGCHPEGRDDGHVWHEIATSKNDKGEDLNPGELFMGYRGTFVITLPFGGTPGNVISGFPRQTPMLAGRVTAQAPYGWRAEAPSLESRLRGGFALHRWSGDREAPYAVTLDRPKWLAAFVREGLVAPKVRERPLTAEEERGKTLFADPAVGCSSCHTPETDFTNREAVLLPRRQRRGFEDEPNVAFKTPSLLFVGGTPPYYHDGAADSLEKLIRENGRAMGDSYRLGVNDQGALAAYLRTIGGYVPPFPVESPGRQPDTPAIFASKEAPPRAPARTEWASSEPLAEVGGCKVRRKGRHVQIGCPSYVDMVPIAGSLIGVERYYGPKQEAWQEHGPPFLVLPLQPGDRRVIQLTAEEAVGKWGTRTVSAGIVQVHWLDGDEGPTISACSN